jgi:hypothetical protein
VSDRASARATDLWSAGDRWDEVLRRLRADGFTKNDAIRASVDVLHLSMGDAKRLVHGSDAWLDAKDRDERLHEALVGELRPQVSPRS